MRLQGRATMADASPGPFSPARSALLTPPLLTTTDSYVIVIAIKVKLTGNRRHPCTLNGQQYLDFDPDLGYQASREA